MGLFMVMILLIQSFQGSVPADDAVAVSELVTMIADTHILGLPGKKDEVAQICKKLSHLHPLDFLKTIVSSKPLLTSLKKIQRSSIKWKVFIAGMTSGLNHSSLDSRFPQDITDFANSLNISYDVLADSVQKKEWEKFVKIVIKEISLEKR